MHDILTSIEFQMSLLMFVALAGYLLAYRVNQSAVVGIIAAGVLVGPSLLNLITYTDFVASLANLGAIVLLFTIGLEFHIRDITDVKYLYIALFGVIVPWVGGYFLAVAFGYDTNSSIFIGTALTATSIAITANVLREMGKLQTRAARAIIGAAVIDDVLALLALSISEQLASGTLALGDTLFTALKAVAFIALGISVFRLVLAKIIVWVDRSSLAAKYVETVFIFAIMVAFLYALAAESVGLSGIVGSFLAGVSFSGIVLKRGKVFREGAEHLQIIFAAIFFISLGVLLDIRVVTLELLLFVIALTLMGAATKIGGCGLPALAGGMGTRESLIVGVGMMPRGEVAMIVALIGLNQGLISQTVYAALILMALLTTIIPPILLRNWLYRGEHKLKQTD